MLVDIEKIQVKDRIRRDFGDIQELAEDIRDNGLINPPVVTPDFVLIAGERRLRAMDYLGYKQIEVRLMKVNDYIHQLNLEISENESRKEFTKRERFEYTQKLIDLKRLSGVNLHQSEEEASSESGIGSRKQYYKEKSIIENADSNTLDKWDKGEITTHAAYQTLLKEKELADIKVKQLTNTVTYQADQIALKEESIQKLIKDKPQAPEPTVIEKEVVKAPEDYEMIKRSNTNLSTAYDNMLKEKNRLLQQLEAAQRVDEYDGYDKQKIDSAHFLCSKIYSFLTDVGGLSWVAESLTDLPDTEQIDFVKSIHLVKNWSSVMIQRLEEIRTKELEG